MRPARVNASSGPEGKAEATSRAMEACWPTQEMPVSRGGEEAVDEGGYSCCENQPGAMMADEGSDQGGGGRGEDGGDHGEKARVGDALIGAEADGEGAASGDESTSGMAHEDAGEEAEGYGRGADGGKAEAEFGPLKAVEVGEEVWLRQNWGLGRVGEVGHGSSLGFRGGWGETRVDLDLGWWKAGVLHGSQSAR